MIVRRATEADLAALRELWTEFTAEAAEPEHLRETWEEEGISRHVGEGSVFLAEEEGRPIGFAEAEVHSARLGWLHTLYVRPEARRRGVAKALVHEVGALLRGRGVSHLGLEVGSGNALARSMYERLGFVEFSRSFAASLDDLDARLVRPPGPTFGRVYVQSDDEAAVERAVREFVPRLGRSEQTVVLPPWNGWTCVEDELCSREPKLLRRLAKELSDRTGAVVLLLGVEEGAVVRYVLLEHGSIADEYASVPDYHGPVPPGDIVALGANPTVAARLTGADPARLRAVARTAASPAQLPPVEEIVAQLADVLGVAG